MKNQTNRQIRRHPSPTEASNRVYFKITHRSAIDDIRGGRSSGRRHPAFVALPHLCHTACQHPSSQAIGYSCQPQVCLQSMEDSRHIRLKPLDDYLDSLGHQWGARNLAEHTRTHSQPTGSLRKSIAHCICVPLQIVLSLGSSGITVSLNAPQSCISPAGHVPTPIRWFPTFIRRSKSSTWSAGTWLLFIGFSNTPILKLSTSPFSVASIIKRGIPMQVTVMDWAQWFFPGLIDLRSWTQPLPNMPSGFKCFDHHICTHSSSEHKQHWSLASLRIPRRGGRRACSFILTSPSGTCHPVSKSSCLATGVSRARQRSFCSCFPTSSVFSSDAPSRPTSTALQPSCRR
ncbi:hypothetical protein CALCODRAFT_546245 [Calocera cornea HHB12733]|uniref:Uncharacterized protein n=1 Tax=Calocera cornea HHB12733 TaxID=1353952 RepID=A0A165EPV7_9BASI|nr:hypothetical protein CALCODRAFT_546245 [Calocera cornea HHB12733]